MIPRNLPPTGLPQGYGIGRIEPVSKAKMDVKKDREKQNEEKRQNLIQQKTFLEELMRQQKIMQQQENDNQQHFNKRI